MGEAKKKKVAGNSIPPQMTGGAIPPNVIGQIDWNKLVTNSDGKCQWVPEEFQAQVKEIEDFRAKFNESLDGVARQEITLNVMTQKLFFALREHFTKAGVKNVWVKDIGLNSDGLKAGKFIVNLTDGQG